MARKKLNLSDNYREYKGEIDFVFKDRLGNIVDVRTEPNIVKIFAKEILSHRMVHSKVWDRTANSGGGAWVNNSIDPNEEFSVKYILLGASFDSNGVPLDTNDPRYYTIDPVTQIATPIRLSPGAEYDGGLINAIPLAEPDRPLKRIENVSFEATYQPAGTPQLQDDVRPLNNIVLLETTLLLDEYNGFGLSASGDAFTITEVALAAGKELNSVGACECDPKKVFLEGEADGTALSATASGTDVITLDSGVTDVDLIKEGDQIKIVAAGSTAATDDTLDQISPYYLVVGKTPGGRDVQLDRVPTNSDNAPLTGQVGVLRNTLRIFSHRVLATPVKKTSDFEILIRWRILLN